jgi:predicted glycosyltransferase
VPDFILCYSVEVLIAVTDYWVPISASGGRNRNRLPIFSLKPDTRNLKPEYGQDKLITLQGWTRAGPFGPGSSLISVSSMNVFFNISHPAHFHFFKNTIGALQSRNHKVVIGARKKEFVLDLLKPSGFSYTLLTKKRSGASGVIGEMVYQQFKIWKLLRRHPVDLMLQIGGIFNAPIGRICGIPTLAFSDTENNKWGNGLSFRLSRHVLSPSCFDSRIGGSWTKQVFYPGYHELAYLAPRFVDHEFEPLDNFLVRFVGWKAIHDVGEKGLTNEQKIDIVNMLSKHGKVYITSEGPLPSEIEKYTCIFHPSEIHAFMKTCKMVVGESATMASEAACLGIPAVFISDTGRGYTTEQDQKYGLVKHYRLDQWAQIMETLASWSSRNLYDEWQGRRRKMLSEKIDVSAWMFDLIENYPESVKSASRGSFEKYYLKCAD